MNWSIRRKVNGKGDVMPHDAKGNLLQVGDKVVILGVVTRVLASEDYCNVDVELEHLMPPNNTKSSVSAINTKQVEKVTP